MASKAAAAAAAAAPKAKESAKKAAPEEKAKTWVDDFRKHRKPGTVPASGQK